jgi:putative SOS response-associated peptidase YedK
MCTNFEPLLETLELKRQFGVLLPDFSFKAEAYPGYFSPLIRLNHETGDKECAPACFGLLPVWAKDTSYSKFTYNARTETVAEKRSYATPWKKHQFGIVPMLGFYEPNWETGKSIRYRIERADRAAFGIAALWNWWPGKEKEPARLSFSLLTINADQHPIMQKFHRPGDEKRSIIILEPNEYDAWLHAKSESVSRHVDLFEPAEFMTISAPKVARVLQK